MLLRGRIITGRVCVLAVRLFAAFWTVARRAPLSMGFFRRECWGGFLFPPPEGLPDSGTQSVAPAAPALMGVFFTPEQPGVPR